MTKDRNRKQRKHFAAELARVAMRLQRAPANKIDDLLKRADRCLRDYKMARIIENQKPSGTFDKKVSDQATMQALAEVIDTNVKPNAFALLVFTEDKGGDRCNYVANCNRDDICAAMAEFIAANEERLIPGPETKQ